MKLKKHIIFYLFLILITSSSCTSTKLMTKEIQGITTGLGYEITSPEYKGELYCNVYLNPIEGAGLIPVTHVRKRGTTVVPLILFNYVGESFELNLGERSLDIPYNRFLTDAILAESNTSGFFNLYENKKDNKDAKQEFTLTMKVGQCQTLSRVKIKNYSFFWVDLFSVEPDILTILNNTASAAETQLEAEITLTYKDNIIFENKYFITEKHSPYFKGYDNTFRTNMLCIDNMGYSLSLTTKTIVEKIVIDLNMAIESFFYSNY